MAEDLEEQAADQPMELAEIEPGSFKKTRLLSVKELAYFFAVSESTIYVWRKKGLLPDPLKRFGHPRWDLSEILERFKTHPVK